MIIFNQNCENVCEKPGIFLLLFVIYVIKQSLKTVIECSLYLEMLCFRCGNVQVFLFSITDSKDSVDSIYSILFRTLLQNKSIET